MENADTLYYAGIGSSDTPVEICRRMTAIARRLSALGYILRSGAADRADAAFEAGCDAVGGAKEIWLPWPGFNGHSSDHAQFPTPRHSEIAATVHPAWSRLKEGDRRLHSRNVGEFLGPNLDRPARFVLCWTPDGCESEAARSPETGGTATAIVMASRHRVPVFNLANDGAYDRFALWMLGQHRIFHLDGTLPKDGEIFVFGSNLASRHGKGAALVAREKFGAAAGKPAGRSRQSYAIPTKDGRPTPGSPRPPLDDPEQTLPLEQIAGAVAEFIEYAKSKPAERFFVTRIGCGLAGYRDSEIAPLFAWAPINCSLPEPWREWLLRVEPVAQAEEAVRTGETSRSGQADLFGE
ncbi:hypothetical protein [Burkholderia sp. Ac-20345]|uniref:A1S_2505 family phage non-structural protein n=1 Tax=Burkholderia sp. Ac-20345 TaxID=2703891 RepID=UPI00197BB7B2|nr:hypothetical protein [Burkholderia sp. Ac-20345]